MADDYRDRMAACAEAIDLGASQIVLPTDRTVHLNGIDFHYLDWGNEHLPHVVLLHGGSLQAHTWDMACLLLRKKYHLVALDQRGHGDTDWTPEEQLDQDNGDLMLEDTHQFIEHLGYEHLTLVGMSMGGVNSMRHAARHPERLDALVIVDVGPVSMREGQIEMEQFREATETLEDFDDFLNRAIKFIPTRAPEHLNYSLTHSLKQVEDGRWTWKQDHRRRATQETSEDEIQAARDRRAEGLWEDLKSLRMPMLLMRGDWSKIMSADHAEEIVRTVEDAALVVIPKATHNVHSDNPKDFARELNAYLSRTLVTAAP